MSWKEKLFKEYHDILFEFDIFENILYRLNDYEAIARLNKILDDLLEVMKKYHED